MKQSIFAITLSLVLAVQCLAQAPESIKYQAIVRDAAANVIPNKTIGMQISILKDSISGPVVYKETFSPQTNNYGSIELLIGTGTPSTGTFATIDWSNGTCFIETATDVNGGSNYQVMGTSQFLSVPYALHSNTTAQATAITKAEKLAIVSPKIGQFIFCTDCGTDGELQIFNGTIWTNFIGEPAKN